MKTQLLRPVDPAKAKKFFEDKVTFTTGPIELQHMIEEGEEINIVDVRAAEDYEEGHIPGAVNLPQEKWGTFEGLEKDKTNIVYTTRMCVISLPKQLSSLQERAFQ